MFKCKRRDTQAGVTLIELMVVVTIIALFVALVGPALFKNVGKGRITAAKSQIESFGTALGTYKLDVGSFPTTEQGLQALVGGRKGADIELVGAERGAERLDLALGRGDPSLAYVLKQRRPYQGYEQRDDGHDYHQFD